MNDININSDDDDNNNNNMFDVVVVVNISLDAIDTSMQAAFLILLSREGETEHLSN